MKVIKLIFFFAVLLLFFYPAYVNCQEPAPIYDMGKKSYSKAPVKKLPSYKTTYAKVSATSSAPASMSPDNKVVVVKSGDSLYEIAKKYGVSARQIIDANNLQPPYKLEKGQKLVLTPVLYHKVKKGDTLYSISRKYGVDVSQLVKENKLKKPYSLMAGQKLKLPYQNHKNSTENLQSEETISKIEKPIVVKKQIADIDKNSEIAVAVNAPVPASKMKENLRLIGGKKGPVKFQWPLEGKIISKFGAKEGGIINDGINIAAPEGKEVRAAADGVVVYTGSELKGYGNLIIIKHKGDWITAYAHQKKFEVRKGQLVKCGQIIGEVGSTGNVDRPQLHFAIRKGRDPEDPLKYLST